MVCDASPRPDPFRGSRPKSFRRLASTRGFERLHDDADGGGGGVPEHGYIRVHEGPAPFAGARSKLVKVGAGSSAAEAGRCAGLGEHLALWLQVGGSAPRKLEADECPLRLQEAALARCGWVAAARRARLAVDPELRHALRWCAGPRGTAAAAGARSGTLWLLKGLVFPQWKPRQAYIVGSQLCMLLPGGGGGGGGGGGDSRADTVELSGGIVEACEARGRRPVLLVRPRPSPGAAAASTSAAQTHAQLYLGFGSLWERNLWLCWLTEASHCTQPPNVVDISSGGERASVGAALADCARSAFDVRVLRLCSNRLQRVPRELFQLSSLVSLDLSDNNITEIPHELKQLTQLEELVVSGNALAALGGSLRPPRLRTLRAHHNLLRQLDMDMQGVDVSEVVCGGEGGAVNGGGGGWRAPLTSVDLRHNRLKGSIVLGSYEHLVYLDVSHNAVEVLVVSALRGLRELRAAHNALRHLAVHGAQLRTLLAPHNQLETLVTMVPPCNLVQMDVSHNKLESLPPWLSGCSDLTTLHATNNKLAALPDHLFCSELSSLSSLRLAHNRIATIPSMPRLRAPLTELLLHDNCIHSMPENFFSACDRLCTLNLSNNRLNRLPPARGPASYCLERLYLSANCLDDSVSEVLIAFRGLKILHLSYNCISSIPETCISLWPDLEEIVVSGNMLHRLPDNLPRLKNLKVVRAHSNRLRSVPMFASNPSIKILDLAHNEMDAIELSLLAPKQLKYLDISCNKKLQVDASQFHAYRCQRPMSLVDVTGQNSLPWQQRDVFHDEFYANSPWTVGFSECPDRKLQLCSSQIRLSSFCNREGLFAIIDGEDDDEIPKILQNTLPGLLLEEKSVKETANEYMKYVVLSAHRELKEKGQKKGACLVLCHISPIVTPELGFGHSPRKYMLRLSNVGETKAVLSRRSAPISIGKDNRNRLGYSARYPEVVPDPDVVQTILQEDDEFIVLGNKSFWRAISVDTAVTEARAERNPILAAKRLQDLAQSYGLEECVSVMIVRFDSGRSDVDMLMRELRQTIGGGKSAIATATATCRSDCCCARLGACCHSASPPKPGSDRSSPSGQSDRQAGAGEFPAGGAHYASGRSGGGGARGADRRSCRGGVARAIRVRVEEDKEPDRPPSEEQFKCWEYMLEQNTQLLFDKELDTLSRGAAGSSAGSLRNLRGLSGSSPQLHSASSPSPSRPPLPARPSPPFLSKHFGSARSFGASVKPDFRFGSGRLPVGGPNAAYFGSLQRLMPYHLEYDFAVIQERSGQSQDSLDLEGRMQQYWGVATTEL